MSSPFLVRWYYLYRMPSRRWSAACFRVGGSLALVPLGLLVSGSGESTASAAVVHRAAPDVMSARLAANTVVTEINAVRRRFGLAPGTATTAYQRAVVSAAFQFHDPILSSVPPTVITADGIWGAVSMTGSASLLNLKTIVDMWVYEDGWKGRATRNIDCVAPGSQGCNGHRRAVLRSTPTPGAKLTIDVYVAAKPIKGMQTLSVAAVLSWAGSSH
jgi:hypothetical protein